MIETDMRAAALLLKGGIDAVQIKPKGNSMEPLIKSGQAVTVRRMTDKPEVGDIVLVTVWNVLYLHKVLAIDGDRVQIGNNKGHVNGWTHRSKVWGYVPEYGRRH